MGGAPCPSFDIYVRPLVSLHAASNRTASTTAAVCLVPGEAEAQIGL